MGIEGEYVYKKLSKMMSLNGSNGTETITMNLCNSPNRFLDINNGKIFPDLYRFSTSTRTLPVSYCIIGV